MGEKKVDQVVKRKKALVGGKKVLVKEGARKDSRIKGEEGCRGEGGSSKRGKYVTGGNSRG